MSKITIKINTRDEAESAMQQLAKYTHKRDKVMAKMNQELTDVRARYENEITQHGETISAQEKALKKWADRSPELFGKLRSLKMTHGIIGYRIGQPAVKLITGISVDRAIAFVKERLPQFIRVKEEIDKEGILAERANLTGAELALAGLRIEQAEKFFVEPEKDEVAK